jgi:hypothetical protein
MLYEYAMTPDLYDSRVQDNIMGADIILTQLLRGIAENGLIANLHKDKFVKHVVNDRLPGVSQKTRDRIIACINLLDTRRRVVRHPVSSNGDPVTDFEWLNIVMESQARCPFQAIFLSEDLENSYEGSCSSFVQIEGALDSEQWLSGNSRSAVVTKTPPEFNVHLKPVLKYARSIQLIDPFMNSDDSRFLNTVDLVSQATGDRGFGRLQGRINIHTELKNQRPIRMSPKDYLDGWSRKLQPLIDRDNHRFRVFLWTSLPGSEHMHDRYILTDQCGLSIPGGLDCRDHSHANTTDFILIDEEARLKHWDEYDPATSPFDLEAERKY